MDTSVPVTSEIDKQEQRILQLTGNPELAAMFSALMLNTLETTLFREADGTTFVITGDIPAMWLRDSSAQLLPFLRFLSPGASAGSGAGELADVVVGLVKRQFEYIGLDSYANAFNREPNGASFDPLDSCENPWVWE